MPYVLYFMLFYTVYYFYDTLYRIYFIRVCYIVHPTSGVTSFVVYIYYIVCNIIQYIIYSIAYAILYILHQMLYYMSYIMLFEYIIY